MNPRLLPCPMLQGQGKQRTHIVPMQGLDAVETIELHEEGVGMGQDVRMVLWKESLQDLDFILPPRHITHMYQSHVHKGLQQ